MRLRSRRAQCTYPGPKLRTVNRFTRRDVLGSGDIERVVFLFALRTVELDLSLLFCGSEVDRRTYCGGYGQRYGCRKLVVWHDRVGRVLKRATEENFLARSAT